MIAIVVETSMQMIMAYALVIIVNVEKELTNIKKNMQQICLLKTRENMIEKLMTLLVGILLALAGWTLTRTFDLSTNQAVQLDKVSKLERQVEKLEDQLDDMQDSDKEIIEQHELLFKKLENSNSGYSYN